MRKMVSMMLAAVMVFALAMPAFAAETANFNEPVKKDVYCNFGSETVIGSKVYHVVIEYSATEGAINDATKLEWNPYPDAESGRFGYEQNTGATVIHNPTNSFKMTNYSNNGVNYTLSFEYVVDATAGRLEERIQYEKESKQIADKFISNKQVSGSIPSAENSNFQSNKDNLEYWAGTKHDETASITFNIEPYKNVIKAFNNETGNYGREKLGTLTLTLSPQIVVGP